MQAHLQYHPPSAQSQYSTNGIHHDSASQRAESRNGYTNGGDMNPYQQYGGGNPYQSQHPQNPYQQQPSHPQQPQQPSYMQNQLPPLGQGMPPPPMPGMAPVRDDQHSYPSTSANSSQPMQAHYMPAPSQPMLQPPQPQAPPPQQSLAPPSRAAEPKGTQERKMSASLARDGLRYSLEVVQQPQRARMCGFGDKDRRPITPPPCVRLVIVDEQTGREVDVNDIPSDPAFFVLQVDLWAESADREANVVRASSSSPAVSISSATTTSYPPPQEAPRHHEQPMMYMSHDGTPMYANVPGYAMQLGGRPMMPHPQYPGGYVYPQMHGPAMAFQQPPSTSASSAMYTRNLIGSLTVNAARLSDNENKVGYWFVLQDLSVRTEGFFR